LLLLPLLPLLLLLLLPPLLVLVLEGWRDDKGMGSEDGVLA
jgi:hypothetical protein